jgi:hypothetical protein
VQFGHVALFYIQTAWTLMPHNCDIMTTPSLGRAFAILMLSVSYFACAGRVSAQGMPLDSILPRIGAELHNSELANSLTTILPNYANLRVWGMATGDFTNDALPDVALSLFDLYGPKNQVRVYLFANNGGHDFRRVMERPVAYIESPIEVGLTIDGSVVTLVQKTGDQHWTQLGYSVEFGDLILVDRYETEREDMTGSSDRGVADTKAKSRTIGHDVYRNYENLRTRETYTSDLRPSAGQASTGQSGTSAGQSGAGQNAAANTVTGGDEMFSTSYFTLPAYQRLREIYPGYGKTLSDTSREFVVAGAGLRRDASDVSIKSLQAAYDDDNIYISATMRDDYIVGGQPSIQANDRISLWFDSKYSADRQNRDRRILTRQGGYPTFRDALDSLVTNLTVAVPRQPGRVTQVTYSSTKSLTALQQEGLRNVRGQMSFDTVSTSGTPETRVEGYTLRLKIPFAFLNLETNPAKFYESVATKQPITDDAASAAAEALQNGIGEVSTLGWTGVVYDVDDPLRANEFTAVATSQYHEGNPSTFGTLVLEPSSLYYGEVHATYLDQLRQGLSAAGF